MRACFNPIFSDLENEDLINKAFTMMSTIKSVVGTSGVEADPLKVSIGFKGNRIRDTKCKFGP